MPREFQAVYEQGLLRPLEPLPLAERQLVTLYLGDSARPPAEPAAAITAQQAGWMEFVAHMESLPSAAPGDGLSNRDHDRLIYGD